MKKQIILCGMCLALAGMMGCNPTSDSVQVNHLQVEMKNNPQGIDVAHPRFSWQIHAGQPDLVQTGYRIQVAASADDLKAGKNLLWDSGDVKSDQSLWIAYEGEQLQAKKPYFWRVKVDTNQGSGKWSDIQT